jgi:hypothetical protein
VVSRGLDREKSPKQQFSTQLMTKNQSTISSSQTLRLKTGKTKKDHSGSEYSLVSRLILFPFHQQLNRLSLENGLPTQLEEREQLRLELTISIGAEILNISLIWKNLLISKSY